MYPRWWIQLLAVALKEIRHTLRDKRMLAVLLLAPALQLGIFGFAVDFDVDRVATVVVDNDQTEASRQHLQRLLADGTLVQRLATSSAPEAERAMDRGEVSAALLVPPGFGRALALGEVAHLQVIVDGTDPNRGSIAAAAVSRYARSENGVAVARMLRERQASAAEVLAGAPPELVTLPRVLHNPRLRTALYMVPGIIALLLLIVTVIVTSMGLARERETGTLEQILVTPIGSGVLLVGKLLPYVVIGLFDFVLALAIAAGIFDVPIRGPLGVAVLGTTAYLVCTLGIGLLISTFSRTQQQAFIGGFLFLLPTLLLSGVMTPIWGVPEWLSPWTQVIPVKHYAELVRGVLLRGSNLQDLSLQLGVLVVEGVSVLSFAAWRFHRSLA